MQKVNFAIISNIDITIIVLIIKKIMKIKKDR